MKSTSHKRIAITGACGSIAYSLLPRIAHGDIFGHNVSISLHLLEVESALPALKGVAMELEDLAMPLLQEVHCGSDPYEIFKDIDLALLIGAKPRSAGMERKDLLQENAKIFLAQGHALEQVAPRHAKVLVVGNPCNTNAYLVHTKAPSIPQIFALTRLDQNRAQALLAKKAQTSLDAVTRTTIWGNHSLTQVPDTVNTWIHGRPVIEVLDDPQWLDTTFIPQVQTRGGAVLKARGHSSAASAASAIIDCCKDLYTPSPKGYTHSLALLSNHNPYGIESDLIFSFPSQTTASLDVEIAPGFATQELWPKLEASQQELLEEKYCVLDLARG